MGIVLTVLSLIGNILVARRNKAGFYFWLASNFGWIYYSISRGLYDQLPLWIIYTGTALYSIYEWSKEKKK